MRLKKYKIEFMHQKTAMKVALVAELSRLEFKFLFPFRLDRGKRR
jgi:hypothetical protein